MPVTFLRRLADEVRTQPELLSSFATSGIARVRKGTILVGAGDSYAAALAGFYISKGRCIALDPYTLGAFPEMAKGRDVVFISASGRTSSNVAAAGRVRGVARRTWGITADVRSELAMTVDETIRLPMSYVPKSPGLLSFTLSLLAVLKMATGKGSCDFRAAFNEARNDYRLVAFGKGTTYFLGNSAAYAMAVYAAGKTYELLGAKCHPELLEEFSHMQVFSLRRGDAVNIFGCFDPTGMGGKLCKLLTARGHQAKLIPASGGGRLGDLFRSVFGIQLATLREASARGLKEPRFLSSRSLRISDQMIY